MYTHYSVASYNVSDTIQLMLLATFPMTARLRTVTSTAVKNEIIASTVGGAHLLTTVTTLLFGFIVVFSTSTVPPLVDLRA